MTRANNRLTALAMKTAPPSQMADGRGLIFDKGLTSAKWLYRYSYAGKRREMGLGGYPAVSLAEARKARDRWAAVLLEGRDPIRERAQQLAEAELLARADPSLSDVTAEVFDAIKAGLRGEGTRGRWRSPLDTHILPTLGSRAISEITAADLRDVLKPIWSAKHATAEKAIQRLGIIFRKGKLTGHRCDPFTVEQARHMLGEVHHVPQGIVHTHWRDIPELFAKLGDPMPSAMCLRMIILTAARSDSVRGMRFSEIDGDVWTIPADRMKGRVGKVSAFRVPLSPAALELVQRCADQARNDWLFPSVRDSCISQNALLHYLNDRKEAGRPHGFRSSFREWVQDTNSATYDVAETVLAHHVGSQVERTYSRSDLLDLRRVAMGKWADHVTGQAATVVRLRG